MKDNAIGSGNNTATPQIIAEINPSVECFALVFLLSVSLLSGIS